MKRCTQKNPTTNDSTHCYLYNWKSNDKIHQEVFEQLHRKGGAKLKHKVFRNAPGSFRFSAGGEGWGRERV